MIISLLFLSLFITSCSTFDVAHLAPSEIDSNAIPSRENLLDEADKLFAKKSYDSAKTIYTRLTYIPDHETDPIYNQALWKLSKIYEKSGEYEKAVLALEEISSRENLEISKSAIKISLIRNHYRLSNRIQAEEVEKELAADYRAKYISISNLAGELLESTQEWSENQPTEDALFLGTIQKYFIYVMESPLSPQNSVLLERLKTSYDHFFNILENKKNMAPFNKKMSVVLYDQLVKFENLRLESPNASSEIIQTFSEYADNKKKYLVERFNK